MSTSATPTFRRTGLTGKRDRATVWLIVAAIGAICGSAVCSVVLRTVDRQHAWIIVPIAWIWGLFALSSARGPRATVWGALLVGLLVRVPLVGTPAHLSDDGFRYLWEGLAANHGINPFLVPPSAVHGLDDGLAAQVNHPDFTSIYPPLALLWFRGNALFFRQLWGLQGTTAAVDLITVGVLARVAPRGYGWVYALHPLSALESASGAHLEPVSIALTVGALLSTRFGPAFAALGIWSKAFPIAFWPSFFLNPPRTVKARFVIVVVTIAGGVVLTLARQARTRAPSSANVAVASFSDMICMNCLFFCQKLALDQDCSILPIHCKSSSLLHSQRGDIR